MEEGPLDRDGGVTGIESACHSSSSASCPSFSEEGELCLWKYSWGLSPSHAAGIKGQILALVLQAQFSWISLNLEDSSDGMWLALLAFFIHPSWA